MELWVRSQDKKRLMKVNGLHYVECGNTYIINGYGTNEYDNYDIGIYETKERALEVMDEIQEAQLGNYHYRCPSNVKVSNNGNMIIYEMPKE